MVLLVVKGTKFPDEFVVEAKVTDLVAPEESDANTNEHEPQRGLARILCHIQNSRHHLHLMLLSAQDLADHVEEAKLTETQRSALDAYKQRLTEYTATLKDRTTPVLGEHQFDEAADVIRELTVLLYPEFCTKPDFPSPTEPAAAASADGAPTSEREAVIQELYAMHENPELDEDARLLVYHCRAILDPHWKSNEGEKEEEAGLWFCGKLWGSGPLSNYCGRNERSKVTVKIAPRTGPAPSGEPRMRYEDQRALYAHMRQRREVFQQLEESELRDRVVRQSRGQVVMPSLGGAGAGADTGGTTAALRISQLRPIYPKREERVVSE